MVCIYESTYEQGNGKVRGKIILTEEFFKKATKTQLKKLAKLTQSD